MYEIVLDLKVVLLNAILQKNESNFVQSTYQMWMELEFLLVQTLTKKSGHQYLEVIL